VQSADPNTGWASAAYQTKQTVDALGDVLTQTDANGHTTSFAYDALGEQVLTTDPLGNTFTTNYTTLGQVSRTYRNSSLNVMQYGYDGLGRLVRVTDPDNHTSTTVYDTLSRAAQQIAADGSTTQFAYDLWSRPVSDTDPRWYASTTAYAPNGQVQSSTDANGHMTSYGYDAFARRIGIDDANGHWTTMTLDRAGQVKSLTDPDNNTTTFTYDALERMTSEVQPLETGGATTTFAYNALGALTTKTTANGGVRTISYDLQGRETGETYSGNYAPPAVSYTYDAAGNLLTASGGYGSYTFTYDAANRLATIVDPGSVTLTPSYDSAGNRTQLTDSRGGTTTSVYDAARNLTSRTFTDGTATLRIDQGYDALNRVTTQTRFSDLAGSTKVVSSAFTYDRDGNVTDLVHTNNVNSTTILNLTYTYDAADQLASQTVNGTATPYSYDPTGQLTAAGATAYSYDANGNTTTTGSTLGPDNQVKTDGTYNYYYDNDGNLTSKVAVAAGGMSWYMHYDTLDRLYAVEAYSGGTPATYEIFNYDALGNRRTWSIQLYSNGVWQPATYIYSVFDVASAPAPSVLGNPSWPLLAEIDGGNNILTRYLSGAGLDQYFARVASDHTSSWLLTDRQGSVLDVVDKNTAAVQGAITYNPFGGVASQTNASNQGRLGYDGALYDAYTGLDLMGARWYDPQTGRWNTQDPLAFGGGDTNLYRADGNAPTDVIDPSGLDSIRVNGNQVFWVIQGSWWNTISVPVGTLGPSYTAGFAATSWGAASPITAQSVQLNWGGATTLQALQYKANNFENLYPNIYNLNASLQLTYIKSAVGSTPLINNPSPLLQGAQVAANRAPGAIGGAAEVAGGAATAWASAASTLAGNPAGPFGVMAGGGMMSDGLARMAGLTRNQPSLFDAYWTNQGMSPQLARQTNLAFGLAGAAGAAGRDPCPGAPRTFRPNSTPVPQGHTRAYRAVSEAEYQDILATGRMRQGPNSLEGKWFADSLEGAQAHGTGLYPDGRFRLVEVDIPNNAPSLATRTNLDGRGPARYLHNDDLPTLQPRPLE
jgi:RHS repeat-associated protein